MSSFSRATIVIPAKAGIQRLSGGRHWVPAFAGTTEAIPCPTRNASTSSIVIPAKAGIQRLSSRRHWVVAFAGTTEAK